jgi:hypothetical protein
MSRDANYTPFGKPRDVTPTLDLVETLWRLVGPSGKPIICCIYRNAVGLEVHCHYAESIEALIRSERVADLDTAHDVAEAWKQAAIDKGFTEIPALDNGTQK